MKKLYGLIGFPLSHSFSKKYFTEKFAKEQLTDCVYELFPLQDITGLPDFLVQYPDLKGFNVTIPHKQSIIPFLDELAPTAQSAGAVNTVVIDEQGRLTGFNTDVIGFQKTLEPFADRHSKALVLGTGGAGKAVVYVLQKLGIPHILVSRHSGNNVLAYSDLDQNIISEHTLIINTTPLGMYPAKDTCPPIPFQYITENHLLYDLVYNPTETLFLSRGKEQGAHIQNGLEMLYLQAEAAWELWNPLNDNQ